MINAKPLDVFLVTGNEAWSKKLKRIIKARYGEAKRTHIEFSYDGRQNLSAEGRGMVLVDPGRLQNYRQYRFKSITSQQQADHPLICEKYMGKPYAVWRYILDAINNIQVGSIVMAGCIIGLGVLAILMSIFWGWMFAGFKAAMISIPVMAVLWILLTGLKPVAKYFDKRQYDCTELFSLVYSENGLWVSVGDPRNEFPDGIEQVFKNLVKWGVCDEVV